jgi:hypothetical protein
MPWFSIRAVYVHERTPDGTGFFEERILLFSARDAEHAVDLADGESQDVRWELGVVALRS